MIGVGVNNIYIYIYNKDIKDFYYSSTFFHLLQYIYI